MKIEFKYNDENERTLDELISLMESLFKFYKLKFVDKLHLNNSTILVLTIGSNILKYSEVLNNVTMQTFKAIYNALPEAFKSELKGLRKYPYFEYNKVKVTLK